MSSLIIRLYQPSDREAVRQICAQTAFLEKPDLFVDNHELLADILSSYFTDYEPESCFVAQADKKIVGYILGTTDINRMNKIIDSIIYPKLFYKGLAFGVLLNFKHWRLIFYLLKSTVLGEFIMPQLSKIYQATFHINILQGYRGQSLGHKLIVSFVEYLKKNNISSVYVSTLSEQAKDFFVKEGFEVVFYRRRSYLKYRLGRVINCYVFGRRLST